MDFKDYLTSQQQNIYVVLFKNEQESIIRFKNINSGLSRQFLDLIIIHSCSFFERLQNL